MKWTTLTFECVALEEVTEEFLVALLDVCHEHGLDVEKIGIDRRKSSGGRLKWAAFLLITTSSPKSRLEGLFHRERTPSTV